MFASVPQVLIDFGIIIGVMSAFLGLCITLIKFPLTNFIWNKSIKIPFTNWFKEAVVEAMEDNSNTQKEHFDYVKYHLGPNGTTTPVYVRIGNLEIAQKHMEFRQKRFLDNINVAISESDEELENIYVNQTWCRLFESQQYEMMGQGWLNFVHPDSLNEVEATWEYAKNNKTFTGPVSFKIITKSGKIKDVIGNIYPLVVHDDLVGYISEIRRLENYE